MHKLYAVKYRYKQRVLRIFFEIITSLRFPDLYYYFLGIIDANKKITGKYSDRNLGKTIR